MSRVYPGYDLTGKIAELVKASPGDEELIMKLVEEIVVG